MVQYSLQEKREEEPTEVRAVRLVEARGRDWSPVLERCQSETERRRIDDYREVVCDMEGPADFDGLKRE